MSACTRWCESLVLAFAVCGLAGDGAHAATVGEEALDRLAGGWGSASGRGWRAECAVITREALPDALQVDARLTRVNARGVGGGVGVSHFADGDFSVARAEVMASLGMATTRLVAGGASSRYQNEQAHELFARTMVSVSSRAMVDLWFRAYPGSGSPGSAQVSAGLYGGGTVWIGGVVLSAPGPRLEASLGLHVRSGMVWMAAWDDDRPWFGVDLDLSALLLSARGAAHPLLGSVVELRVQWGAQP